jgi:creatinine amidohydrolase/Fe(II)-dependent formamide hydrolase-like protein
MILLAECTWPEARTLARDRRAVVLLPLGAVEQHGPHLPLLVDWLGSEELARRVAPHLRRAGYTPILAPALPYGVSTLAEAWSGTVSLSAVTLRRVIVDIVGSLARHGFRRFVLANYQADPDHIRAMASARRTLERTCRVQVLYAGFAPDAAGSTAMVNPQVVALMRSPRADREWHSGELETALMLARRPGLVRRSLARRLPPVWLDFRTSLRQGARRFEDIDRRPGARGYFGWPATARPETAERAMALRGRLIAHELITSLRGWSPVKPSRGGRAKPSRGTRRTGK